MKKTIKFAVLSALAAMGLSLQAQVSSNNAAGYIKVTVQEGEFAFIQLPFNKFDGGNYTLKELLGTSLPANTIVYLWDEVKQEYEQRTYIAAINAWFPFDNPELVIPRGQGIFVQPAVGGGSTSYDIYLYGEVPGATSNGTTSLSLVEGYNAVGFPYPAATTVEQSGLTDACSGGDILFLWDSPTQNYVQVTRINSAQLPWFPANKIIEPGSGMFIFKSQAPTGDFLSTVPYSYPNN